MFKCLMEAIESVERSKREVELRIKARAQEAREQDLTMATAAGVTIPWRLKIARLHRKGRTMYTSGSRSSTR